MTPLLEGVSITKHYGSVKALTDVDLRIVPGEVVGLLGENGAGKSTLVKILTGAIRPDRGVVRLDGQDVAWDSPSRARQDRVVAVHQEPSLIDTFSVAENVMLGNEPCSQRLGALAMVDAATMGERARQALKRVGVAQPLDTPVGNLSIAELQLIEVARALVVNPRVLVLDEATSRLMPSDVERLFSLVREMTASGSSVIVISHRLEEVLEIADRIYILKDGRRSGEISRKDATQERLIQLMVGRDLPDVFPTRAVRSASVPTLSLRDARREGRLDGLTLDVFPGEVLGVGGLEGHGQRDLVRALAGLAPFDSGEVAVSGETSLLSTPLHAIHKGIVYVPEDRREEGLVFPLTITENVLLPEMAQSRLRLLSQTAEHAAASQALSALSVRAPGLDAPMSALSGGNQQKVMFAKWLRMRPRVLLLHEPTRGVDVETRVGIYRLIRDAAGEGVAIVLVTSDMMELINLSSRIAVFYEGHISGVLDAPGGFSEERIMRLAVGGADTQ